jgi:trigger factor
MIVLYRTLLKLKERNGLTDDLKNKIADRKSREAKAKQEDEAIAKIIEDSKMDIPDAMVDTQVNRMVEDFAQRLQQQGLSVEQYFQYTGMTADKIMEEMKPEAVKRIQSRLVLEAVVKAENIETSEEDFEAELKKMAEAYKMELDQIKEFMGDYEKKQIKEDLAIQKAIEVITGSVVEK